MRCTTKLSPKDLLGDAHWLPESVHGGSCHGALKRAGQWEDHVRRRAILLPQRVRRQLLVTTEVPAVEFGDHLRGRHQPLDDPTCKDSRIGGQREVLPPPWVPPSLDDGPVGMHDVESGKQIGS